MKCPVCGYANDSKDEACIACGSDMALAEASIALEKRRSHEAMERYHDQQKALRRELGIEGPDDEPLRPEGGGEAPSPEDQGVPGDESLELEAVPADFYSAETLCPQCGFRSGEGVLECVRCGVIFSKLKRTTGKGHGLSFGAQNGGIAMDSARYGLEAMPPDSAPSVPHRREAVLDDLGECLVDTSSGYSPYVHEARVEPWSRVKATGRWVKDVCARADVVGKGETVRQGGQRVWRWLKGVKPTWYGAIFGMLLVLASLPFAWKGGALLKSEWVSRSRIKREATLIAAFAKNNDAIRGEIRALANEKKFAEARAALSPYDIPPLKKKIEALERYLEEKETYARVLEVPAWQFETNHTLFTQLVGLNPSSELYRTKQDYYKKRWADQCYGKALKHYQGQTSDAAESDKALGLIEKAVRFYPKNRDYKKLRSKLTRADLLYYKGNPRLQIALRDEGRGTATHEKQRKITVWLRNTSADTLYINPDFFTLETRNGKSLKYNNMMETGLKGKLAPGEKTAGILYFRTLAMPRQLTFDHLVAGAVQRQFP